MGTKRKPAIFIDIVPVYRAGDPPPAGYIEWHEWALVQMKAGLRQKRCKGCGLWRFPQEMGNHGC